MLLNRPTEKTTTELEAAHEMLNEVVKRLTPFQANQVLIFARLWLRRGDSDFAETPAESAISPERPQQPPGAAPEDYLQHPPSSECQWRIDPLRLVAVPLRPR